MMELSQQLLAVGLVLSLLLFAVRLAQRRGWLRLNWPPASGARPGRSLVLIERFSLTPQHQLHLMRVGGEALLLATSPQGVTVVSPVTSQETAPQKIVMETRAAAGGRP